MIKLLPYLMVVAAASINLESTPINTQNVASMSLLPSWLPFQLTQPFPQWLSDFTGLKEWPTLDPPYIPLDFIDFGKIEHVAQHEQSHCEGISINSCSFDCQNCVAAEDVYTCPQLSQTFDDGPTPSTTKLLSNLNSRCTFFVLGHNVVRHPDIYRRAIKKGHIMGTHTWSHKFLPSLSNEDIIAQIQWSIWAMNATSGHIPKWFRPPYGGVDNRVRSIINQFGMQSVLWDFDTFDWQLNDNSKTSNQVLAEVDDLLKIRKHGLILEHDMMTKTVNVGIEINKKIPNQLTVPQCVGGIDYIKVFE